MIKYDSSVKRSDVPNIGQFEYAYNEEEDLLRLFFHSVMTDSDSPWRFFFSKLQVTLKNVTRKQLVFWAKRSIWIEIQRHFRKLTDAQIMELSDKLEGHTFDIENIEDDPIIGDLIAPKDPSKYRDGLELLDEIAAGKMKLGEALEVCRPKQRQLLNNLAKQYA